MLQESILSFFSFSSRQDFCFSFEAAFRLEVELVLPTLIHWFG